MQKVLKSVQKVAENSKYIEIDFFTLNQFAKKIVKEEIPVPEWNNHYHFNNLDAKTVMYILVLDTLNFCFWPLAGQKRWEISFHGKPVSGYFGLAAGLKMAVENNIPILDAQYLSEISVDQFKADLGGTGDLQIIEQRVDNLNELGKVLLSKFNGDATKLVASAQGSAMDLVKSMAKNFSSFNDVAEYQDQSVFFYKRAQIFVADLYGSFSGQEWGKFFDIDQLTAFADYKLPQVLRQVGILKYNTELADIIDQKQLIPAGSDMEIEIRATTIYAVDQIRKKMTNMGKDTTSIEIDWRLWNMGQSDEFRKKPYHLTTTMFY